MTKPSQHQNDRPVSLRLGRLRDWVIPVTGLLLSAVVAALSFLRTRRAPVEQQVTKPEPKQEASARYTEEGPFPRLQDRVLSQLGFVNNLLITLAVAVLAFAANGLTDRAELRELSWRRWLLTSALVLLALSLLVGIRIAHSRLQAVRISARTARLRQRRDRWLDEGRSYEFSRLQKQAAFFGSWGKHGWTKRAESKAVRRAAATLSLFHPPISRV